ncbi:DUF2894 domain-containing protein [Variovorax sp. J22R115]|uniref:DUF2894 domain-containing protein n=1 Tax=Variovorax sp. J22R115 TaxID=3053509 RepID=UPI0025774CD6|nr:DUF2894 domain-containing protein [Variovorax sp. J22R115]MDM0048738.1 DUF2894 domain-containing protein [Variovorax sp. J22R115]
MSSDEASDALAMIDARRRRGDHRLDPVRFRFIEALAKRSATHRGEARRILDDKVARLLAAYAGDLEKAPPSDGGTAKQNAKVQRQRGALGALVDHIGQHASPLGDDPATRDELKTLTQFRSTWSRLSAERRLTQSQATVPQNAGPLNSHHLVHRSLRLMRDVSPEYLSRFMSYVDALLGLDQLHSAGGPGSADAPRAEKKVARGKSG